MDIANIACVWEHRKLGEVAEIVAGGDVDKSKLKEYGKYPVIANALTNEGIVGYYDDYYRIKTPAVTVTGRGDIGHAKARDTNFTPVVRLLTLISKHNSLFLENAINLKRIYSESTGVPQLTAPQLSKYKIGITDIEEEIVIGTFFYKLDKLITLHQRKLEQLEQLKNTLLSKMFPKSGTNIPEIRFSGFTDAWKQRKLGEVSNHRGGTAIEKYFDENGKYKVISIGSYGLDNRYVDQGIRAHSNEITDKRIVYAGELTMILNDKTANGTIIGRTLLIENDNEYVVNQRTEIISPKEGFNSRFAYTLLNGPFRHKIKQVVQGGTQIYVNYSSVEKLTLYLPIIEEQKKVGVIFEKLDKLITIHQRKPLADLFNNFS